MVSAARRAIEKLYTGRCTVIVRQDIKDPVTKITSQQEIPVLEDLPCRLSHERLAAAGTASPAALIAQSIKVFMAPEIAVPPGSKLVITQNAVTEEYANSGKPAVYATHQEITLNLFERWA